MTSFDANELRQHLADLISHVTFDYLGRSCGVEPLSINSFELWFGDNYTEVTTIDEVFTIPFFNGKCLNDIIDQVENLDY